MNQHFRIGSGYDVHAFADNRKLKLGGIDIPFEKGLQGHSDADALLHAICDAMLGALSLGDIGKHFPDTDPQYKNIDSRELLANVYKLIQEKGYELVNVDSTVVMQRPKLFPHIDNIKESISRILECSADQVSVKATTSEQLGFVGLEEGIKTMAVVLLVRKES